MRNPRIYQPSPLVLNSEVELDADAFGHVVRVLRLKDGDAITLFNGDGYDFDAVICQTSKKAASAKIVGQTQITNESPLKLHLGQGISRGDRMDFTLQKSVELGVTEITPVFTERCGVKLSGERLTKKLQQWQKIVISACEQSGRAFVPTVNAPISLDDWLAQATEDLKLNLHPRAEHSIMTLPVASEYQQTHIRLLIGPEGGLSDEEIAQTQTQGFTDILLGPRVLRTETAALTALTALQCRFGDLGK